MAVPVRRNPTIFPYRGKWRLTYVDSSGRTRTKATETRQEAYNLLIRLGALAVQGKIAVDQSTSPTLESWLFKWMNENSSELRHKTRVTNEYIANKHVIPIIGQTPIGEITPMLIEDFYRLLMTDRGLSASTVHRIHAFLNVPLAMAARYGLISTNPLESVKKPKKSRVRISIFTTIEVERILSTAAKGDFREYLRWVLAIHYGLRQGEVLALTRSDFDGGHLTLTIDKQVQPIAGRGFIVTPPKSEMGNRILPVDPDTARLFDLALAELQPTDELLFPGGTGAHRHSSTDRKNWVKLLRNADVRYLPLHSARHTAATNLVKRGIDPRTVQLALGHSSPSFTLSTYVHPDLLGLSEPLFQLQTSGPQA